jgi:uncharacterized Zn finger protein
MRYWNFKPYVSVAEKQAKAARKLAQLKKKDSSINPVVIEGSAIASTWWGKSWNRNLERYADYSNRIGRGRSYVRNGMVLDLQIHPGRVDALVQGTAAKPYAVAVAIDGITSRVWNDIKKSCQGQFESLPELMEGQFPKSLGEMLTEAGRGLFPSPKEISFSCSCPDWAYMCKHVAATLYGIGARLDQDPLLFFTLRKVDVTELISQAVEAKTYRLLQKAGRKSSRVMESVNLSDMFGIEFDETPAPAEKAPVSRRKGVKKAVKKPVSKRVTPDPGTLEPGGPATVKNPRRKAPTTAAQATSPKRGRRPKAGANREKSVTRPSGARSRNAGPKTNTPVSATALVESIVLKSRGGMDAATLVKKTGFDDRKIYGIVARLKKLGRIAAKGWGLYGKP